VRYASLLIALLILAISTASLWSFAPMPLRLGAITEASRLLWGAIFLTGFGYTALACCSSRSGSWAPYLRLMNPLHIGIGQALMVAWFLMRGAINAILPFEIPFSIFDPLLIFAVMLWWLARRGELADLRNSIWKQRWFLLAQAALLSVILLVIAQRELPRIVMLSSDPDQHAYFVEQIRRLATTPFTQEHWGPNSLGYPIGFPLLNFSWVTICGVDSRNLITIQPILQTVLAVLAFCGVVTCLGTRNAQLHTRTILTMLALSLFYFCCIPFGYQDLYYHSEGVGRIGSMLTLVPLFAALAVARSKQIAQPAELLLLGVCGLLCITINPVHIVQVSAFLMFYLVISSVLDWRKLLCRSLLVGTPFLLLLADPYFSGRLVHGSNSPTMLKSSSADMPWLFSSFIDRLSGMRLSDVAFSWFDFGLLDPAPTIYLASILLLLVLFVASLRWVHAVPGRTVVNHFSSGALWFPWLNMIPFMIALALFGTFSAMPELYLLEPYLYAHTDQVAFMWFVGCIALIVFELTTKSTGYLGALLLVFVAWFGVIHPHGRVNLTPRYGLCDALGCVNDDDLLMIAKLEEISANEMASISDPTFTSTPKILVLNALANTGREEWLFPYGAARILPSYNTLPLAFFYFQGSPDFSFANYKRHVCSRLDLKWLRARNIKYIFIPSSRGDICARGLMRMIERNPTLVVAQSGEASIVKLF